MKVMLLNIDSEKIKMENMIIVNTGYLKNALGIKLT